MRHFISIIILLLLFACKDKPKKDLAYNFNTPNTLSIEKGVVINMGKDKYVMPQEQLIPFSVKIESDSLSYTLRSNESDVSLSLNLINTGIVKKKRHSYSIPEDTRKSFVVGLSFFNKNKNVSRLNKRIVFRKGIINIEELTKNTLIMTFDGEGSGMRDIKNSFPISGSVNIKY